MRKSSEPVGRRSGLLLFCLLFLFTIFSALSFQVLAETPREDLPPVAVIPVHQTIETGLQSFLERAFQEAHELGAEHIILDINTFGGRLDAAEGIGEIVRNSAIPTVAFVHGKAVSAGSYIALNADQIVMEPGSTIGSAAVVDISGNLIENPKIIGHWVSAMQSAAELNGRNPEIAAAMVDPNIVVEMPEIGKKKQRGEILSLSADEALKVGYAEAKAESLGEVIAFIGAQDHPVVHIEESVSERLARFLTHPITATVLLIIGIAGVAVELLVPGFGFPGILGIAAFVLYFFGHYVSGFAGWEEIVLFIIGILLLVIELFVPSFGILGGIGVICLVLGVALAAYDTQNALISLGVAFAAAAAVLFVVIKFFKYRGIWNKFILKEELRSESGYVSTTEKDYLLGKTGVSVTPLRPAGTVLIDGNRVDVVTNGEFIPSGRQVVVYLVEGGRVVVRETAGTDTAPNDKQPNDEQTD